MNASWCDIEKATAVVAFSQGRHKMGASPVAQPPTQYIETNTALVSQLKTLIRAELSIIPEFAASDIGEEIVGELQPKY
jgi:hypothetical protein